MAQDEELDSVSVLEKPGPLEENLEEFRDAILNDTYSDEYNLTEVDLSKLTVPALDEIIGRILNELFQNDELIPFAQINEELDRRLTIHQNFESIYAFYLSRPLEAGESNVLNTALRIIFWKINGKTFKNICWYRYAYASRANEREIRKRQSVSTDDLFAAFITGYNDIPDKNLNVFSLFGEGTKASDVQYDLIMYDTYDYIDKLIGFKLSDVYYAAFIKYFEKKNDIRAYKLARMIRYGTDHERFIWMLRYGMSFEDIQVLDQHIKSIDSEEISFSSTINDVADEVKRSILRFIH